MAIGYDASSKLAVASTSGTSFNWNHTPSGTPKGVVVFTFTLANADDATAVTYGGVTMNAVTNGRAVDTGGEPGDCKAWFLGSGVPTGTANIVVTRNPSGNTMMAFAMTVTSSQNSAVHDAGTTLRENDQALTQVNVTDGSSGTGNSLRVAAAYSGCDTFLTAYTSSPGFDDIFPAANSTYRQGHDFGTNVCIMVHETTPSTGSQPVGFISANNDTAAVHIAIKDVVGGATTAIKDMIGLGIIPFAR